MSKFQAIMGDELELSLHLNGRWIVILPESYKKTRGDYILSVTGISTSLLDGSLIKISGWNDRLGFYMNIEKMWNIKDQIIVVQIVSKDRTRDNPIIEIRGRLHEVKRFDRLRDCAFMLDIGPARKRKARSVKVRDPDQHAQTRWSSRGWQQFNRVA